MRSDVSSHLRSQVRFFTRELGSYSEDQNEVNSKIKLLIDHFVYFVSTVFSCPPPELLIPPTISFNDVCSVHRCVSVPDCVSTFSVYAPALPPTAFADDESAVCPYLRRTRASEDAATVSARRERARVVCRRTDVLAEVCLPFCKSLRFSLPRVCGYVPRVAQFS